MKFSIKDFFSICYQICRKPRIWSHLLKKTLMENFIFLVQCNIKKCNRIWPMSFRIWTENEDMCATVIGIIFSGILTSCVSNCFKCQL